MALVTWVKFLGEKLKVTIPLGRGSPRRQDGEDDKKEDDIEEVQKEDEDERTSPCQQYFHAKGDSQGLNFGGTRKNTQTVHF